MYFLAQYGLSAQLDIWGYCLMSNHVHLIVVPRRFASFSMEDAHLWQAARWVLWVL